MCGSMAPLLIRIVQGHEIDDLHIVRQVFPPGTGFFHSAKIVFPEFRLVQAQLREIFPAIDACIVPVVKLQSNGIIANRLQSLYPDILFACLQHFLPRSMPPDFR